MRRRLRGEGGFALTEILASLLVAIVVLGAGVDAFTSLLTQGQRSDDQTSAQDSARAAVDHMAIGMRSAMASGSTSQPVERSTGYDLVYLSPVPNASLTNNPLGLGHIRYCVNTTNPSNEKLWRQTAPYDSATSPNPPSATACPGTGWTTQVEVASNIVNQAQGKPFFVPTVDGSGNVTDLAIDAIVDANPAKAPPATELRSSVTLRNLNRPPTAAISCQAQNGHGICDASASVDPDGGTLFYAWKVDGAPVSETSYKLDQPGLASGSTHTFMVTVTDNGGLTASASKTLVMP